MLLYLVYYYAYDKISRLIMKKQSTQTTSHTFIIYVKDLSALVVSNYMVALNAIQIDFYKTLKPWRYQLNCMCLLLVSQSLYHYYYNMCLK